jgi:D-amino peptidase
LEASITGYFGVPVALVTGDDKAAMEARELLGDVETVAVKEGLGRTSARLLPRQDALRRLKAGAKEAYLKRKQMTAPRIFDRAMVQIIR